MLDGYELTKLSICYIKKCRPKYIYQVYPQLSWEGLGYSRLRTYRTDSKVYCDIWAPLSKQEK